MNILASEIPKSLDLSYSAYYELNLSENNYKIFLEYSNDAKFPLKKDHTIYFSSKLVEKLKEKKSYLYINDLLKDEKNAELVKLFNDLQISICYPIFDGPKLEAILIYSQKKNDTVFHKEDLEILEQIVDDASLQMGNIGKVKVISIKHAEEILTKYKDKYQVDLINEIKNLSRIHDLDKLCDHTQKVVNRLLYGTNASIYIFNDKTNTFQYRGNLEKIDGKPKEISVNHSFINYVKQQEGIISVDSLRRGAKEIKTIELLEALEIAEKLKSKIIIPLKNIENLGLISLENKTDSEQPYYQDDFMLLDFLGDKLESAISNILLHAQANTDNLTSLSNQRYLQKRGREEIVISLRDKKPISALLIDVDKFKNLNDKFGYEEGNKILSAVSACILSCVRGTEECFRYGGEEFLVIFHGGAESAKILAERINSAFKTDKHILGLQEKYAGAKIRVSIGVATFTPKEINKYPTVSDTTEIFTLLKIRSNKALKQAKKQGRDRVCSTKMFDSIESGKNMDDFIFDVDIISENPDYKNIKLISNNILLLNTFDNEKVKYCDCVIFDISGGKITFDFIEEFNEGNRGEKYIGIISNNTDDKKICDEKGYKFFVTPIQTQDIQEWLFHIKINGNK